MSRTLQLPSIADNPDGLHQRYAVTKIDGVDDPRAIYIVLRVDKYGDDQEWLGACRAACAVLASILRPIARLRKLSNDLLKLLDMVDEDAGFTEDTRLNVKPFVAATSLPANEQLALDVDKFERARSLHRVVRAMHDGECPKCHALCESDHMIVRGHSPPGGPSHHRCPRCGFEITAEECAAVMGEFSVVMDCNLAVFEQWRAEKLATDH